MADEFPQAWTIILRELDEIKALLRDNGAALEKHKDDDSDHFSAVDAKLNRLYGGLAVLMGAIEVIHYLVR